MSKLAVPFNIELLSTDDNTLRGLRPVISQDIFDGMTKNFNENGLYSSTIFGKVGDERRKQRFAFIEIRLPIFHPVAHKAIVSLKRLYGDILNGKAYARWDSGINDFVAASPMDGETGYGFFIEHWEKIQHEQRPSDMRSENIALLEKYKKNKDALLPKRIVVLPAGLRDFEIQDNGKYAEEEVNGLYKRLMALASTIPKTLDPDDAYIYNATRVALQRTFNEIYELFESMIKGKKKLIQGKWASRKIYNGTRNVITSMSTTCTTIGDESNLGINDTIIGMYQFLKAVLPISKYLLRNGFLSKVFTGPSAPALLVDKLTLEQKTVNVKPEIYDSWMTDEGIEKVISLYGEESLRHKAIEINGHYLGLVYKGKGVYKVFQDIRDLPSGYSIDDVKPLTFIELMYISVARQANKYPIFVTRYPIGSAFSIYPSFIYLKTTTISEKRVELDDNWEPTDFTANQFPITGMPFVESLSPHPSKLKVLNADFDGDTASGTAVYSVDSIEEVRAKLDSRNFYVGTDGKINFSTATDTIDFVLANMTGDPEDVSTEAFNESASGISALDVPSMYKPITFPDVRNVFINTALMKDSAVLRDFL